jgi:DNA-binding CsgD family transcriptional regulator
MTDDSDPLASNPRWVAAWRETVAANPSAVGLVDLVSTRFLELSPGAAELLGVSPEAGRGLDYLTVAERPEAAEMTFQLARQGLLDGLESRRGFRRGDGERVEVHSYGHAIRSSQGSDLGLWVVASSESEPQAAVLSGEPSDGPLAPPGEIEMARLTLGIVGDEWRVICAEASRTWWPDATERVGTSIVELAHPRDAGMLLLTLARATTAAQARARLRWHIGDTWPSVLAGVTTPEDGNGTTFHVTLERMRPGPLPASLGTALPSVRDLPARQKEVLVRLVRGERVRQIAAEMYLSESTVRNHLAAIFRKIGVHSQHELLTRLRHGDEKRSSGTK